MHRTVAWCLALTLAARVGLAAPVRADVIVATYFDSAILRYGEDGTALQPIVPPGGMKGVVAPAGMTFGPDSSLYVSNQTSVFSPGAPDSIVKVDPTSGDVTPFITLASGYVPAGLRFGPDGNLYVSRNGGLAAAPGTGTVDRYDGTTGQFLASVVTNLTQPSGLVFDAAGNLYVSNFGGASIVRFDGTNASTFASAGSTMMLAGPSGLQFGPDGKLYVVDLLLGALRRYDPTDASIDGLIPVGGQLNLQYPSDLLFDRLGNLLVADLGPSQMDPEGNIKAFDPVTGDYRSDFATKLWASQLLLTP